MAMTYYLNVVWALILVGVVLYAALYLARTLQRGKLVVGLGRRLVTTVESTALAQHATIHVVKIGERYYLLGAGNNGVSMLTELPAGEIEPYIETQRALLDTQRASVARAIARFRKS